MLIALACRDVIVKEIQVEEARSNIAEAMQVYLER